MPGIPNTSPSERRQLRGSEYGGVQPTLAGGIQPKDPETLTNGELLRLGYITGNETETRRDLPGGLEDLRQSLGLLPAEGGRPNWLEGVSPQRDPRKKSNAEIQGYDRDGD